MQRAKAAQKQIELQEKAHKPSNSIVPKSSNKVEKIAVE